MYKNILLENYYKINTVLHTQIVIMMTKELIFNCFIWNILCVTDINDCSPGLCQNGGTCTDLVDAYSCACTSGWTGSNCDIG
jgi:hypothetical protein